MLLGLFMVWLGGFVAYQVQTDGGTISIRDVRFMGSNGVMMSALLYIPPNATADTPAPGIVAVHGYINSRETQSGYAIEFARRGYVVLAVDQSGHGYSDPPAFANGFGGPDGLAYIRTLNFVDIENIGLEGHSMGGWALGVATAVYPDGYKSFMLQGSSTGTFGAPEGTATSPRNLGLVFSTWDEFSLLMWGAEVATKINETDKLKTLFDTTETVEVGRLYGSIEEGTARKLYQPATTHPGDHLNSEAIGNAIEWMQLTLTGGNDLAPSNQVWMWKEIATLVALIGMIVFMLPFGAWLLELPFFVAIVRPLPEAKPINGVGRYIACAITIVVPIVTYFWLNNRQVEILPASALFPQTVTSGILIWALGNAAVSLILFLVWHFTTNAKNGATISTYGLTTHIGTILKAIALAVCVIFAGYLLLALSDFFFKTDFRFWVVAIKLFSPLQFQIFLGYLPFFTLYFLILGVALNGQLRLTHLDGSDVTLGRQTLANVGLLVIGFIGLLLFQYLPLLSGAPLPLSEPLLSILAFQFVPLLTIVGVIMTFFFRRTGTVFVGAFICSMLITWIIVASTATQFAF